MEPLLEIRDLATELTSPAGPFLALDGVTLTVGVGASVGLVGESGSGKSMMALSVLGLLPPGGRVVRGQMRLGGKDLLGASEDERRRIRGGRIAMVFQDPMTALDPVMTIGRQIDESLRLHRRLDRTAARAAAIELLARVGIPAPAERVHAFPHELSGGMRQRAMIAIALAGEPELLIADEPTTALDVTVQAEILELLRRLRTERKMALLLITHDLGVVAENCDEAAVMYAGRIAERAPVRALFRAPLHPYTAGLLRSVVPAGGGEKGKRLSAIPGAVPDLQALPAGCRFRERCDRSLDVCASVDPPLEARESAHWAACHHPLERP